MTEEVWNLGFGISFPEEWTYSSKSSERIHLSFVLSNLKVTLQYEQRTRSPDFSFPSRGMSASQMGHSNSLDMRFLLEFRTNLNILNFAKNQAIVSVPSGGEMERGILNFLLATQSKII